MKIATWNVNSVRKRTGHLIALLERLKPDVLVLQELKAQEEQFPRAAVETAGYRVEVVGQKGFNGVALLSRSPVEVTQRALPGGDSDIQSRYVEARIQTAKGPLTVGGIYLPNGNPIGTEKFTYKLDWMKRLLLHAKTLLAREEMFVLCGDYNVCPTDVDVFNPAAFAGDALCHWPRDFGLRIDHLLLSPQAADRLSGVGIERDERGLPEPSDHVPVWCELDFS